MGSAGHIMRSDNPQAQAVVEYLRTHGEASVKEMKAAGIDVPNGFMSRMRHSGYVLNRRAPNGYRTIWRLK